MQPLCSIREHELEPVVCELWDIKNIEEKFVECVPKQIVSLWIDQIAERKKA